MENKGIKDMIDDILYIIKRISYLYLNLEVSTRKNMQKYLNQV